MDINLLGELVVASAVQTSTGFWMPAGGNDGVAGLEVFLNTVANAFDVIVQTKSSDQTDASATTIGTVTVSSTAAASYKFDITNAKDLVRYVVSATKAGNIHLQLAQPLWHPN